jgi:hypothetical protein
MQVLEGQKLPDILLRIPRSNLTKLFWGDVELREVLRAEDIR